MFFQRITVLFLALTQVLSRGGEQASSGDQVTTPAERKNYGCEAVGYSKRRGPNPPLESQWVWAVVGHWRGWSAVVTLEQFYLEFTDSQVTGGRALHSPEVRAYGRLDASGFDFDLDGIHQLGHKGPLYAAAWAATAEVVYCGAFAWKPRLNVFYGQATGDADLRDGRDNRVERCFGFASHRFFRATRCATRFDLPTQTLGICRSR